MNIWTSLRKAIVLSVREAAAASIKNQTRHDDGGPSPCACDADYSQCPDGCGCDECVPSVSYDDDSAAYD